MTVATSARTILVLLTTTRLLVACDEPAPDGATATAASGSTGETEAGSTSTTGEVTPTTGAETTTTTTGDETTTTGPLEPPGPACAEIEASRQPVATLPQGEYYSLAVVGDTLIAAQYLATDVIDVTDPADPILHDAPDDGTSPAAWFATVDAGRVYFYDHDIGIGEMKVEQHEAIDVGMAFLSVDPPRFAVSGAVAYAPSFYADEIRVIDLEELHSIPQLAQQHTTIAGTARHLVVADGHLYALGDSLRVFSLADPKAPALVATLPMGAGTGTLAWRDDYLYVTSLFDHELLIFDVADPSAPVELPAVPVDDEPKNIVIAGDFAFISSWYSVLVFDLADATQPQQVASIGHLDEIFAHAVHGEFLYMSGFETTEVYRLCSLD